MITRITIVRIKTALFGHSRHLIWKRTSSSTRCDCKPGGALRSSPHFEGTREFLTLQKGRLRIESGADAEELNAGDSASYRADVPHALLNAGKTEVTIFLIVIYR